MNIDYDRFQRVAQRSAELGADLKQPAIIAAVYKAAAEAPIAAYLSACGAVKAALTAFAKENRAALEALRDLDDPYGTARSAVQAILPDTVLPDTLKTAPTDTDKILAVERLGVVEGYWSPLAAKNAAWVVSQMTPQLAEELFERLGNMQPSKASLDRLPKALSKHRHRMRYKEYEAPLSAPRAARPRCSIRFPAGLEVGPPPEFLYTLEYYGAAGERACLYGPAATPARRRTQRSRRRTHRWRGCVQGVSRRPRGAW